MERYEAVGVAQENLAGIVGYLDTLHRRIHPEFEKRNWKFDVGVDIKGTACKGSLVYGVKVHRSSKDPSSSDIFGAVRDMDPEFDGLVGLAGGDSTYPVSSFMDLKLLRALWKNH